MMTKTAARKRRNMRELVNAYRLAKQNGTLKCSTFIPSRTNKQQRQSETE